MNDINKPLLNNDVLTDLIGDDDLELIRKFKVDFLKQAQLSMKKIVTAFKASQFPAIKEEAHFLKTSAKAIGAEQTGALLEALEQCALSNDAEQCKHYIVQINHSVKAVYEVISNEV